MPSLHLAANARSSNKQSTEEGKFTKTRRRNCLFFKVKKKLASLRTCVQSGLSCKAALNSNIPQIKLIPVLF